MSIYTFKFRFTQENFFKNSIKDWASNWITTNKALSRDSLYAYINLIKESILPFDNFGPSTEIISQEITINNYLILVCILFFFIGVAGVLKRIDELGTKKAIIDFKYYSARSGTYRNLKILLSVIFLSIVLILASYLIGDIPLFSNITEILILNWGAIIFFHIIIIILNFLSIWWRGFSFSFSLGKILNTSTFIFLFIFLILNQAALIVLAQIVIFFNILLKCTSVCTLIISPLIIVFFIVLYFNIILLIMGFLVMWSRQGSEPDIFFRTDVFYAVGRPLIHFFRHKNWSPWGLAFYPLWFSVCFLDWDGEELSFGLYDFWVRRYSIQNHYGQFFSYPKTRSKKLRCCILIFLLVCLFFSLTYILISLSTSFQIHNIGYSILAGRCTQLGCPLQKWHIFIDYKRVMLTSCSANSFMQEGAYVDQPFPTSQFGAKWQDNKICGNMEWKNARPRDVVSIKGKNYEVHHIKSTIDCSFPDNNNKDK